MKRFAAMQLCPELIRRALAQTAAAPKLRMGFFYIPHGAIMGNTSYGPEMDRWTPSGAGADFKLSPILAPLDPDEVLASVEAGRAEQAWEGDVIARQQK